MSEQRWTSQALFNLLRDRYPEKEYALLGQVRNVTGFGSRIRTADAIAMSLWPSRGLLIAGFEIKISRSDWRREMVAPEKADEIAKHCDQWWVVAPDGIVPADEVPATWGLLEAGAKGLRVARAAQVELKAGVVDRDFLAAILRRVQAQPVEDVEREIKAETDRRVEALRSLDMDGAARLRRAVDEFERASGVQINEWSGGNIGEAVRLVQAGADWKMRAALRALTQQAEALIMLAKEVAPETTGAGERSP